MDLNEIAIFIKVIQVGSFSKAGQELNIPKSTVSMKVSSLEKRLGMTLIKRTTRKLHITPAGEQYFKNASEGLAHISRAEDEVKSGLDKPQGLLRITAPVDLGNVVLAEQISSFLKKYPAVQVELLLTDRRVDLLAEGVDLAIRAGHLSDSSMIAKKLGEVSFALFASNRYLQQSGIPKQLSDLNQHSCIMFSSLSTKDWVLENGKRKMKVPLKAKIIANDIQLVFRFTLSGEGIALLPSFICQNEVKTGKLVQVLADWRTNTSPVHFVYPAQKYVPAALSAFISHASEGLKQKLR